MKKGGSFVVPSGRKKTPFQKHKEAEADRKKREEEEAAKVYEDFVESFGVDAADAKPEPPTQRRRFGSGPSGPAPFQQPGRHDPTRGPPPQFASSPPAAAAAAPGRLQPLRPQGAQPQPSSLLPSNSSIPPSSGSAKGGKRQIDLVMEAIKGEQERRNERKRLREDGTVTLADVFNEMDPVECDPDSTNLYVGNLAQSVAEEVLLQEFGRFGPIASVKVMWPRSDDERRRTHNSGFVAFMTRASAEAAVAALHGYNLHGSDIKIGFGKAVPIPAFPIYPPPAHVHHLRERVKAIKSGLPAANGQHAWGRGHVEASAHDKGVGPDLHVQAPQEPRVCFIIDTLARFVIEDGTDFEQLILEAEYDNPEYEFLRNVATPEHLYYRWRLWSLCNDDSLTKWRGEPFVMVQEGPRLIPPLLAPLASTPHEMTAAQLGGEKDRDRPLSDLERERWEDMLRQLRVERADIENAMVFCLDHAESAGEAAQCLVDSLTLSETPLHLKIARLYLLSDILHNSTAPVRNASRFRALLQPELPAVFLSMHAALVAQQSRVTQEALKKHVLRVLRVWRDWYLFAEDVLNGLQAVFLLSHDPAWDALFPDKIAEWRAMDATGLERACRMAGLPTCGDDRDAAVRYLVIHRVFATFGAAGPPSGAAAAADKPPQAPAAPLVAGYESDGDATPPHEKTVRLEEGQTIFESREDLQPAAAPLSKWETVADEPEQAAVSTSQWLADKQAKAQAEAEARAQEEARVERLRALEAEAQRLQAEAEAAQARAAEEAAFAAAFPPTQPGDRGLWEPGELADAPEASPAAALHASADSELRRRQRDVEVQVMTLKEDLEERGARGEEIEARCATLRAQLLARLHSGEPSTPPPRSRHGAARGADRSNSRAGAREPPGDRSRGSARDHADGGAAARDEPRRESREREPSAQGGRQHDRGGERSARERGEGDWHRRDDRRERDRERDGERDRGGRQSREYEREREREDRYKREPSARDERSRRSRSRSPGGRRHRTR